jgi:hypothetical protein
MWFINLLTGFFLLCLGFIIKKYNLSCLIAGYNTSSKKEKKKYNEKLLVKYVSNLIIYSSYILIISAFFILILNQFQEFIIILSWVLYIIFIILGLIFINFDKKIKKR